MFTIGMFSKINRITVKTLRHYDDIGILKPSYVDKTSGYRYYSSEDLPRMHKIITLKQMGFSLTEIAALLDATDFFKTMKELMLLKEREVTAYIVDQQAKLVKIQHCLRELKGECMKMNYDVIIKELPEVIVASRRLIVEGYDSFFEVVPEMGKEMEKVGCKCAVPAYCFNIYHDGEYKEKNIDVEICEAVVEFGKDTEILKFKKIEGVTAACVLHKGPYSKLGAAYAHIFEWISKNGYSIVGQPRESYIDGIWNKDSEDDWLTELQIPVSI